MEKVNKIYSKAEVLHIDYNNDPENVIIKVCTDNGILFNTKMDSNILEEMDINIGDYVRVICIYKRRKFYSDVFSEGYILKKLEEE